MTEVRAGVSATMSSPYHTTLLLHCAGDWRSGYLLCKLLCCTCSAACAACLDHLLGHGKLQKAAMRMYPEEVYGPLWTSHSLLLCLLLLLRSPPTGECGEYGECVDLP